MYSRIGLNSPYNAGLGYDKGSTWYRFTAAGPEKIDPDSNPVLFGNPVPNYPAWWEAPLRAIQ